jgi:ribosomal protein S18 acetylase RimI-like enzyme
VTEPDLLRSFAGALAEGHAALGNLSGGSAIRDGGLLLAAGPHPRSLIANTAIRFDPSVPAHEALSRTRRHYGADGWTFDLCMFLPFDRDLDDAARAAGWHVAIRLPCLAVRFPLPVRAVPDGYEVRPATRDGDQLTFGRIVADCFGGDAAVRDGLRATFATPEVIGPAGWPSVIASVDGREAAVASWFVRDGVGIVGFVGTLPAYRRRGLGDLVTRLVTNAAFDAGARFVALQASSSGLPVYEAMGYELIGDSIIWSPPED